MSTVIDVCLLLLWTYYGLFLCHFWIFSAILCNFYYFVLLCANASYFWAVQLLNRSFFSTIPFISSPLGSALLKQMLERRKYSNVYNKSHKIIFCLRLIWLHWNENNTNNIIIALIPGCANTKRCVLWAPVFLRKKLPPMSLYLSCCPIKLQSGTMLMDLHPV